MRLGRRLALAFTTVTASVVAVSFVGVFFLVRRDELGDLDRALALQAAAAALVIEERGAIGLDGAVEVPEDMKPLPRFIAIYAPDDSVQASSANFKSHPPERAALERQAARDASPIEIDVEGERLRGLVVRLKDGRSMLYAASRRAVDADERFLAGALSALFGLAVSATTLAALLLGARLSRDVEGLAAVARAVSDGQLEARAGTKRRASSELKALASDLDLMIDRLGALVVAQGTFVSHAAHELRSPFAALRGELQLALRRPRTVSEYQATLAEALSDVEDLVRLTEDLLTLARVQGNAPGTEAVTVADVLEEATRMARGRAKEHDVEVGVRDETGGVLVRGSRSDVARALRNLVDNAVTHSPRGGRVEVVAVSGAEGVEISVTDEGKGIPVADIAQVFSPFFRGTSAATTGEPGAGLGLAIARGIARSHGGDVLLGPAPAEGACFLLRLVEPDVPSNR